MCTYKLASAATRKETFLKVFNTLSFFNTFLPFFRYFGVLSFSFSLISSLLKTRKIDPAERQFRKKNILIVMESAMFLCNVSSDRLVLNSGRSSAMSTESGQQVQRYIYIFHPPPPLLLTFPVTPSPLCILLKMSA